MNLVIERNPYFGKGLNPPSVDYWQVWGYQPNDDSVGTIHGKTLITVATREEAEAFVRGWQDELAGVEKYNALSYRISYISKRLSLLESQADASK